MISTEFAETAGVYHFMWLLDPDTPKRIIFHLRMPSGYDTEGWFVIELWQ